MAAPKTVDATTVEDLPGRKIIPTGHVDYTLTLKFKTALVPVG